MTDPIEGEFGALILSGWIADAPDTGRDAAFLLAAVSDDRAAVTMPIVAEAFGLSSQAGSMTSRPSGDGRVELTSDGWAYLRAGDAVYQRPVSSEWADVARVDGRVVLVVAFRPLPAGAPVEPFVDRITAQGVFALGLLPVACTDLH
ncbi:DUF5949 family protein [Actinomadura litoris]|uniref:Uncharacterized protein n=1 Tax=Actinomadura litoris TaxID=2678616 RepID=A0A7K1LAD7_9ACTN|nr:DUF5949 family protein [Actinomadura litoris]MUN41388.1 hypothetical protein [Actinomadura litoris]